MFGTVLRGYRTTRGLTQEELADRSGLSVRAIRNLEIGRTERPRRHSITLLASALRLADADHAALLAAAGRWDVPVLAEDAAWEMLCTLVGDRITAEPGAARAVIEACARLPPALQIAGTWLVTRPHRTVADLAALLGDLDRFAVADLSMRASIAAHVAGLRDTPTQVPRGERIVRENKVDVFET
jgi:transcriptional regulator with XRE-family HTH domain